MIHCVFIGILVFFGLMIIDINIQQNKLYKHSYYNNYNIKDFNDKIIIHKKTLFEMVEKKQNNIINTIVSNIKYAVMYSADKGIKNYEWVSNNYELNDDMYEKIINNLIEIFPDVHMEEYDKYNIRLEWTK